MKTLLVILNSVQMALASSKSPLLRSFTWYGHFLTWQGCYVLTFLVGDLRTVLVQEQQLSVAPVAHFQQGIIADGLTGLLMIQHHLQKHTRCWVLRTAYNCCIDSTSCSSC